MRLPNQSINTMRITLQGAIDRCKQTVWPQQIRRFPSFVLVTNPEEISPCGQDAIDTCGKGNVQGVNHGVNGSCSFTCFQSQQPSSN